jgi:uncharacterized protein YjbI with pentapeptide repeats
VRARLIVATVLALGVGLLASPPASSDSKAPSFGPQEVREGLFKMQNDLIGLGVQRSLSVAPQVGWDLGLEDLRPPAAPWYRLWDMNVAWREVNPAPGVFDWSILDRRIAQIESWGGRPLLVLGLTPQWAATDPSAGDPRWGAGSASPPADVATWEQYVTAVASQYGDRIGAYEVWNEANLQTFWRGTPGKMADLTGRAYRIIKSISPQAIVLSPSVTTRLPSGGLFTTAFIKALRNPSAAFDAWAIHTYPAGNAGVTFTSNCTVDSDAGQTPQDCISRMDVRLAAEQRVKDVRAWQQKVVETVGPRSALLRAPIWDTEINYGLAGPGIIPGVDWSPEQGVELIEYTLGDSAALGIKNIFWYQFTATPYDLLGVQMTPGSTTASSYSSSSGDRRSLRGVPTLVNNYMNSYYTPQYGGCAYISPFLCPESDLKNLDLSSSIFLDSLLYRADLYRANLSNSFMAGGTAPKARFLEAVMNNFSAIGADFRGSNMRKISANGADFRNAKLMGVDFRGADLRNANLRGANLTGADFRDADLRGANLCSAIITGTNFTRAKLQGAACA